MTTERIRFHLQITPIEPAEQLPLDEYPLALEFYLQIDSKCYHFYSYINHILSIILVDLFYMKTCSFRGARLYSSNLFCNNTPEALYGLLRCRKPYCRFCFPTRTMRMRAQYHSQPVLRFSPTHQHRFLNGYQAILNCPAVSHQSNLFEK